MVKTCFKKNEVGVLFPNNIRSNSSLRVYFLQIAWMNNKKKIMRFKKKRFLGFWNGGFEDFLIQAKPFIDICDMINIFDLFFFEEKNYEHQ